MRKNVLLLGAGMAAVLAVAISVGAAVATTGAPIFYDARYPAPASSGPEGYDVTQGTEAAPAPQATAGASEVGEAEAPKNGAAPRPSTAPPPGATETPAPTPEATPTPTPDADEPLDDADPGEQVPAPDTGPPSEEERETWLAFQQVVRECMATAGHEYLYWEWWNPHTDPAERFPAMPADLTPDERSAWELARHGETGTGDEYRWEDAGCWGYAAHTTGGTG